MSNALDVISLEQLEKLKKLGLVVVHSKPTKSMFAACRSRKHKLGLFSYNYLNWNESYDAMVGASINQQASEVDWSKYEKPKVTVTWDKSNLKDYSGRVIFGGTPSQGNSFYYTLWKDAITQDKMAKPKSKPNLAAWNVMENYKPSIGASFKYDSLELQTKMDQDRLRLTCQLHYKNRPTVELYTYIKPGQSLRLSGLEGKLHCNFN